MGSRSLAAMVLGMILLSAQLGWCDAGSNEEKVYAIQERIFHRNHELDVSVGYIADDDFFHVYPLALGYTYHFSDKIAWEVARLQYHVNQDKDLKSTLENEFNVTPERFPEQKYSYHTHFVYKPLYGKHAWLNRHIINNEIYFFGGAGMVHYEWRRSFGASDQEDAISLSFGAGLKYFLNQKFCLNVEIRDLVNFREDDTENNLFFGIGLGYRFNLAPRKVEEDPSMNKLKSILNEK
jgi:outer membrane beta-barrel protein